MTAEAAFDYEVIAVGAGPTGILAANLLGRLGVRTLVFDREQDIVTIPRAVGICEEGSRILDAAGLLDEDLGKFHPINNVLFVNRQLQPQFHSDFDWRKDGYRAIRMFHQPELERDMRRALQRYDSVDLWCGAELGGFTDHGEAVAVSVIRDGQRRELRCRFLLGCDGASSPVRKALGIGFSGSTYPQDWVILDIENNPLPSNNIAFSINPERPSVTLPGPGGRRRWEFVVKKNDDVEHIFDEANIMRLLSPWGDMSGVTVSRRALYTFHARTAEHYRRDNVFLLGDAAHITPPFAGQGMMAGLRDAHNLCWKLAAVLRGRAGEALLDSFEAERIPQSKQIIGFAQFVGSIVLPQGRLTAGIRDAVFRVLGWLGVHSPAEGLTVRKLPNHINGSLLRHALVSRFRGTGVELPQHELDTPCGRRVPSDQLLGERFNILGWNTDPTEWVSAPTLDRWQRSGGGFTTLTSGEHFETRADLLLDRSRHFRNSFAAGRRLLVMRPDKMIVLRCRPGELDGKLNRYLDRIGCAALPCQEPI